MQRILVCKDDEIHLKPKTFELLEFLLENQGRVVLKKEIFEKVWANSFVEESNLAVHISALRRIFDDTGDERVSIETVPRVGYRMIVTDQETEEKDTGYAAIPPSETATPRPVRSNRTRIIFAVLTVGIFASIWFNLNWERQGSSPMGEGTNATNRKSAFTFERIECHRDSLPNNLEEGGCEDAVKAFSLEANPNGNWAWGYSPKDELSTFIRFEKANHNHHFASPEIPADWWSHTENWHPLVLKNTSNIVYLIQGAVVLSPTMLEVHPGPNGERSVVRWTAPADGHYRSQGQFRGINGSGYTSTDALIVENGSVIRFSTDIEGYNFEERFDLTFKLAAGDTVDFSVGYGKNNNYEGDSTGFSAIMTTLAITSR